MSRKGNRYDNSVMGNFFGYFKSKQLYLQEFDSTVLWMEQTGQTGYPARKTMERLRGKPMKSLNQNKNWKNFQNNQKCPPLHPDYRGGDLYTLNKNEKCYCT